MTDVFISYSRNDIAFARLIHKSLQEQGLNTWIDWEQIAIGEKWWVEIKEAIENSNVFLFIISEHSFDSKVCHDELDHAIKNNKRIIPIIIDEFKPEELREISTVLPEYNWIHIKKDTFGIESINSNSHNNILKSDLAVSPPPNPDFDNSIEKIQQAIKADYQWVKFHTKLQLKALEWERKKDSSRLLRGKELQETERQLLEITDQKEPKLTSLQQIFLVQSQKNQNRLRTVIALSLLLLTIFMGVLGIWGQKNAIKAQANEKIAMEERDVAENLATINQVIYLSSEAQKNADTDQSLSLLLAIQGIKKITPPLPQAEEVIRDLLADSGSILMESDFIQTVQFSNNDEWMLVDKIIGFELFKVFETPFGTWFSSVVKEANSAYHQGLFSQMGERFVYISHDDRLLYYDLRNDQLECILLKDDASSIEDIKLDPTGRWLAINEVGKNSQLLDLNSPKKTPVLLDMHYLLTNELVFSTLNNMIILGKQGEILKTHDLATHREVILKDFDKSKNEIIISPNSRWLYSNGYIWNLSEPDTQPSLVTEFTDGQFIFSELGHWLLQNNFDRKQNRYVQNAWHIDGNEFVNIPLPEAQCDYAQIDISPDESWFYCSSSDNELHLFDTNSPLISSINLQGREPVFSQDRKILAYIKNDTEISIFTFSDKKENVIQILGVEKGIISLSFFSDDQVLLVLDYAGNLHFYRMDSSRGLQQIVPKFTDPLGYSSLSPGKRIIYSIDGNWDLHVANILQAVSNPLVYVVNDDSTDIRVSPDGRWAAFTENDKVILKDLQQIYSDTLILPSGSRSYPVLGFSREGNHLILAFQDLLQFIGIPGTGGVNYVVPVSPETPPIEEFHQSFDDQFFVFSDAYSFSLIKIMDNLSAQSFSNFNPTTDHVLTPDGQWIYFANYDSTISRVNLQTFDIQQFAYDVGLIRSLSVSSDGKWLVSTGDDLMVRVWDLSSSKKEPLAAWILPTEVFFIEISPDNRWLALGMFGKQVVLYELSNIQIAPKKIIINGALLRSMAFSADSLYLATGSENGSYQLWNLNATSLQPVTVFAHEKDVTSIQFSSDNKWIITISPDHTIRFWFYKIDDVINQACSLAGKNLFTEEWELYFPNEEYREICLVD